MHSFIYIHHSSSDVQWERVCLVWLWRLGAYARTELVLMQKYLPLFHTPQRGEKAGRYTDGGDVGDERSNEAIMAHIFRQALVMSQSSLRITSGTNSCVQNERERQLQTLRTLSPPHTLSNHCMKSA